MERQHGSSRKEEQMEEYYNNNPNFKRFVDRHCRLYGVTVEEALEQEIVRQVYLYYKESEQ